MKLSMRSEVYQPRFMQVAEFLRDKLITGEIRSLAAERVLAQQIGVGRGTLRAALQELEKEGVIDRHGRFGTEIRNPEGWETSKKLSIGVVLSTNIEELSHHTALWLAELRRICYAKNIGIDFHRGHYTLSTSTSAYFRRLILETHHDCWILVRSNAAMQRWCFRKKIPVVISGTVSKDTPLPCTDTDYRALCIHAVGRMLQYGHRDLLFLSKKKELGGDIATRQEFLAAAAAAPHKGVYAHVEYHDGTVAGICRTVDRLIARRPMPTAWLVSYTQCSVTVMMHLLHRGIRIPQDISLIFRDADPYFSNMIPEPDRYAVNPRQHAKQLDRLVHQVISGQRTTVEPCRIIPTMIEGASVGPVRKRMRAGNQAREI